VAGPRTTRAQALEKKKIKKLRIIYVLGERVPGRLALDKSVEKHLDSGVHPGHTDTVPAAEADQAHDNQRLSTGALTDLCRRLEILNLFVVSHHLLLIGMVPMGSAKDPSVFLTLGSGGDLLGSGR